MSHIIVTAPAKINLSLDIIKRRADGYHLLATVMQSLSLADQVAVQAEPGAGGKIKLTSDLAQLPSDRNNTAYRAAELFLQSPGARQVTAGLKIHIEKNIPLAAGLAGGSADAAAVLFALDCLFPDKFSKDELFQLAAQVGADVPFCLKGGTVLCEGIGEILTPLPQWDGLEILLALPGHALLTKDVFAAYSNKEKPAGPDTAAVLAAVRQKNLDSLAKNTANVLEKVSFSLLPVLQDLKDHLVLAGARLAQMSGSGPTVFGLFASRASCLAAKENLEQRWPAVRFLACTSQAGGPQVLELEER